MSAPERIWLNAVEHNGEVFIGAAWLNLPKPEEGEAIPYLRLTPELLALIEAALTYEASFNDGFGHGAARLNLTQAALNLARSRSETKP